MTTQAAHSLLRPRPSGLAPFLVLSIAGHVLLTVGALVLSWAFAGPPIDLEQKPIKASLVRLGKPRDEKLLPRKEPEPPPPPPKPAEVAVQAPAPPSNAVKIPSKDAKPEKAPDTRKSLFDALNKASQPTELEGAADGDPLGDSAVQEGERYHGLLQAVVKRNYDVSDTIPEAERRTLRAQVSIRIDEHGGVLDVRLAKASGNDLFDAAVLGAVKKASPFAPPPVHLAAELKREGVSFVFTP
ncbi:MAG: TonB family protein [Myxococcota bacterium]